MDFSFNNLVSTFNKFLGLNGYNISKLVKSQRCDFCTLKFCSNVSLLDFSLQDLHHRSGIYHIIRLTSSSASEASSSSSSSLPVSPCFICSSEYWGGGGGPIRSESESESLLPLSLCGFLREGEMLAIQQLIFNWKN